MSTTHEENVAGLKNTLAANNAVFTTIKTQYPGSWNDDLVALGKILGITPEEFHYEVVEVHIFSNKVLFKYKDGSKTYNIEYSFFTNILQPEVL